MTIIIAPINVSSDSHSWLDSFRQIFIWPQRTVPSSLEIGFRSVHFNLRASENDSSITWKLKSTNSGVPLNQNFWSNLGFNTLYSWHSACKYIWATESERVVCKYFPSAQMKYFKYDCILQSWSGLIIF